MPNIVLEHFPIHPFNSPFQFNLSIHPSYSVFQITLSKHSSNPPFQFTLPIHPSHLPFQFFYKVCRYAQIGNPLINGEAVLRTDLPSFLLVYRYIYLVPFLLVPIGGVPNGWVPIGGVPNGWVPIG